MAATAGRGPATAGRGPGPVLTESQIDALRMLTALMNKLEISSADIRTHPMSLALQKAAILRWNGGFIYLTADAIDKLTKNDPSAGGAETNLQMACKLQLRALLSHCHELSHKRGGGISINAPARTLNEFKEFRATSYDPTQPIDNGAISPVIQSTNGSRVPSSRPRTDVRPRGKDAMSNAEHKVERKR